MKGIKQRNKRRRKSIMVNIKTQKQIQKEKELNDNMMENIPTNNTHDNTCNKHRMLIACKIENPEIDVELNELMEQRCIPRLNESLLIIGGTGSGKTNLIIFMLLSDHFCCGDTDSSVQGGMPALEASKYPLEQDASIHAPKHSLAVLKHCFPTAFGEIQ